MERVLELVRVLEVELVLRCPVSLVYEFWYKFVVLNEGEEGEEALMARLDSILVKILYTFTLLQRNHTCQHGRMTNRQIISAQASLPRTILQCLP